MVFTWRYHQNVDIWYVDELFCWWWRDHSVVVAVICGGIPRWIPQETFLQVQKEEKAWRQSLGLVTETALGALAMKRLVKHQQTLEFSWFTYGLANKLWDCVLCSIYNQQNSGDHQQIMVDGPWMACQLSSRPSYPQTGPQTVHWFR